MTTTMNDRTPLLRRDGRTTAPAPAELDAAPPRRAGQATMPQAIGHRGFAAAAPENSMAAFRAAVECGAHAIETDLHLSRDGVVMLSHDATLKRCFGDPRRVRDCDWSELRELRTVLEPSQPMARLQDLLELLAEPGCQHVRLMLDIKTDDDAEEMMRRTAETLASVPSKRPWSERVAPCCWTAEFIKLSMRHLPGYPLTHVGFSTAYARRLADEIPDISFSMAWRVLALPCGKSFMRDMRRRGHPVYAWTVDDEARMEWCVRRGLDGVITDDPQLFLAVCKRLRRDDDGGKGKGKEEEEDAASGPEETETEMESERLLHRCRRRGGSDEKKEKSRLAVAGARIRSSLREGGIWAIVLFMLVFLETRAWVKGGSPRARVRKGLQ